jgi:DNA repair exonuclease SbcCD nuclease subunit
MIPGNHDQVTLGGTEHSLTPLQNAYHLSASPKNAGGAIRNIPGILIFSEPTKFLDALFVPHIRDIGSMQSILQSKISASSSGIFVHADVTGAYMNDLITSTHGVAPAYFPPGVPIYSGHFHKPHTVKQPKAAPGVNIRYVGSPYETSLAEAGQEKSLLVLDSDQNWECMEEIPLIMGRKHWRITDIDEFIKLPLPGDHTNVNDENSVAPGDRVVIFVGQEELEEFKQKERVNGDKIISSFDAKVKLLRSQGSAVEIREMKSVPSSPITSLDQELNDSDDLANLFVEDLGPATIWSKFLQKQVIRDVMTDEKAETLNDIGSEIINDIEGDIDMSYATTLKGSDSGLSLEMMTVEGYGPFKDLISYPLKDRGLVLLKGTNRDGESQRQAHILLWSYYSKIFFSNHWSYCLFIVTALGKALWQCLHYGVLQDRPILVPCKMARFLMLSMTYRK